MESDRIFLCWFHCGEHASHGGKPINPNLTCQYCKLTGVKDPSPADWQVTLRPGHPVREAVYWYSLHDEQKWAYKEQEKTIEKLRKKCELLENHIKYQPGGEGALEALADWKVLSESLPE